MITGFVCLKEMEPSMWPPQMIRRKYCWWMASTLTDNLRSYVRSSFTRTVIERSPLTE